MAEQGKNAANAGDMLKHPLICEVLSLCVQEEWRSITYAESHAGAGIYASKAQKKAHHIEVLKTKHDKASSSPPNDPFFVLLKEFWAKYEPPSTDNIKYPGSATLAALALKEMSSRRPNMPLKMRLTELKPEPCDSLKSGLTKILPNHQLGFTAEDQSSIRQAGFQDNLDWLTGEDNLVLVIDPFKLSLGIEAIKKGGIDLFHLLQLLERCKKKTAAVGFWYSTDANSNNLGLPGFFGKTIFENYYKKDTQNIRAFTWKTYDFIWIGFHNGIRVVESLPTAADLNARWFESEIKERVYLKSVVPKLRKYIQNLTGEMKEECLDLLKTLQDNMNRLQEEL